MLSPLESTLNDIIVLYARHISQRRISLSLRYKNMGDAKLRTVAGDLLENHVILLFVVGKLLTIMIWDFNLYY